MIKKTDFPVRYLTKEQAKKHNINLSAFPNAGPYPNITGMRQKFWGTNALLVKQGAYVYNVSDRPDIYYLAK